MLGSTSFLLIFAAFVLTIASATLVQPEWKIYYNMTTNQTIDVINSNNPRSNYYKTKALPKILRIGFGPIPCACEGLMCGCCAGVNIQYFDFNRRTCMNFTYDPYDFAIMVDMFMNDESLFSQRISGKNPPPACMPVPLPLPIAPTVDFCIKFFNIHTPGYNLFMCMDFETRIARAPILILHFDCLKMGVDGIHHQKPEDAEFEPDVEDVDNESPLPEDVEVYDEVFEEDMKNKTTTSNPKPTNSTKPN